MMRRLLRTFILKNKDGESVGTVMAVISHRTAEEIMEDDLDRASATVLALIPARYTPVGGFRRGMTITRGDAVYRMLVPVDLGRIWRVKCERIYVEEGYADA